MELFLLDAGILVGYIRGAGYAEYVDLKYKVSEPPNISAISIVTVGEMYSLALQLGWGEEKKAVLKELLRKIPSVDIHNPQILNRYAEIDAYSLGKNPTKRLPPGMTSHTMGKNDLWIAATASVLNATLLTIDNDFDRLDGVYLKVVKINQKLTGKDAVA